VAVRQRSDERLADGRVAVLLLKRLLLGVWVIASRNVGPRTARQRQGRAAIPRGTWEGCVDFDALTVQRDCQVSVNVNEPLVRNGRCGRNAEQLSRTSAIQRVDTVNDARLCLGEPLSQSTGEKQVLGGAGTAVLTQHPLHCAITRAAIRQCPYGFNKVEQRGVKCGESVDEPRLERGRLEASTLGANRRVRDPSGSRRQGYALGVACP
jgi:hypothetical protein